MLPTDVEYRALQNCYTKLCQQLHYPSIGHRLIPLGVITIEAHESIRHAPGGSREQNEKFVNILARNSSKEGFYKFLDAMKSIATFSDLVEAIETELEQLKTSEYEEPTREPEEDEPSEPKIKSEPQPPNKTGNWNKLFIGAFVLVLVIVIVPQMKSFVNTFRSKPATDSHFDGGYYGTVDTEPLPPATISSAPTMKQLRLHVIPHIATDWEALADILLNSPDSTSVTSQIAANIPTVANRCAELLKTWLKNDVDASWSKLLIGIEQLGHKKLGKNIREMIQREEL